MDNRDPVTGRFVSTRNTPESGEGKFETYADDLPVSDVSGAPSASTIEHPRHAPRGDTLAGTGPSYGASPLRARRPELLHPEDEDHTVYGTQGAVLRTAARGSGPDDPTPYLVGLASHGTPESMVVSDDR